MRTPNPWHLLARQHDIDVVWCRLPHRRHRGLTDGRTIWLDSRLLQVERRSVLTHELVHVALGHADCQRGPIEDHVSAIAARYLIPDLRALADAYVWARGHLEEIADELWVDVPTLRARLAGLARHERELLHRRALDDARWS